MKKNKILLILAILGIILSGCSKPEIRNLKASGQNIVCFGDSLTFGYGAGPGEDYPLELAKLLKQPVINAGVDGDTTFLALNRIDGVLAQNPRLVIVEFCGNDFIKKIPRADTVKNLSVIIDRIQARGAMVALVDISAGMFFREYRADFKKLAAEKKAIFVPEVLYKIITNPAIKSDFFHPNGRGYKIVAKRIYQVIKPYLK